DVPTPGIFEWANEERIHDRYRTSAHREDVAEDSTDSSRGALEGFDERRVIVTLNAKRDRDAVTDVDHPGVLARADENCRSFGRQAPEVDARGFIRAVLAPHDGVHRELKIVRSSAEYSFDHSQFIVGQTEIDVRAVRPVRRLVALRRHRISPFLLGANICVSASD